MDAIQTTFKSVREVAAAIGVPTAWLKAEAEAGRVPCLHAGRRVLLNPDDVQETLANRAREAVGND